eukprot:10575395-Lingulodinium_polyedra.AAC.1
MTDPEGVRLPRPRFPADGRTLSRAWAPRVTCQQCWRTGGRPRQTAEQPNPTRGRSLSRARKSQRTRQPPNASA